MNHQEIAKVVLRKSAQRLIDLRARLTEKTGDLLSPQMIQGLASRVQEESWVVGHAYTLNDGDTESGGAVLEADHAPGRVLARGHIQTLVIEFLGRTPVPPHGGFSADLYDKHGEFLEYVTGLRSWKPSIWALLPQYAALLSDFEGHAPHEEDPEPPGDWA